MLVSHKVRHEQLSSARGLGSGTSLRGMLRQTAVRVSSFDLPVNSADVRGFCCWWFWLVDVESGESLSDVRDAYKSQFEDSGDPVEDEE
jgi:hypothetical protein